MKAKKLSIFPKICPKCGGYIIYGGTRYGQSVDDIAGCLICGLSSESSGYIDVAKNEWVEFKV